LAKKERESGRRLTIAWSDVVDDWPLVAIRPCAPNELHSVSCIRGGIQLSSSGALVTVDVGGPKRGWFNEADVLVQSIPAGGLRA